MKPIASTNIKKIHRIYFGFDGEADPFTGYMETWKRELPDFEIIHWHQGNLDMEVNSYTKALTLERDHAYLSDYFRWWILREHGGVYFDADIEVIKGALFRQIIENLQKTQKYDALIGIDNKIDGFYTAHSMAAKPNADITKFMCEVYEQMGHIRIWRKRMQTLFAPQLTGLYFHAKGHNLAGLGSTPKRETPIIISRVKVYPQDWFSPLTPSAFGEYPFDVTALSSNTCLCHHCACTWHLPGSHFFDSAKRRLKHGNVFLADVLRLKKKLSSKCITMISRTIRYVRNLLRKHLGIDFYRVP